MKKVLLVLAVLSAGFFQGFSKEANDKIESMKIAFITKRLSLTPEESQKFWPIYNKYEAEKRQIRQSTIGTMGDLKVEDLLTDAEAEQVISKYIDAKSKNLELIKKYTAEFRKVLPVSKVAKLITAEDGFKKMLTKQAQQGNPNPAGNGQWQQRQWKGRQ